MPRGETGERGHARADAGSATREQPGVSGRTRLGRAAIAAGAVVAALALLSAAGWGMWAFLSRPLADASDRPQLEALSAKLQEIRGTVEPIARSFVSQSPSSAVEVGSYEARVAAAEKVVESVNDLDVTSSRALEIRDLILTGGSEVVDGMQTALDALKSNDATAANGAASEVADGMTQLDDARSRLDELLGTTEKADAGPDASRVRTWDTWDTVRS